MPGLVGSDFRETGRQLTGLLNGQGDVTRGVFEEVYQTGEIGPWNMIEGWWKAGTFDGYVLQWSQATTTG